MTRLDNVLMKKIVDAIVKEVEPERVYLFGSYARGESREDSDVDLLIVEQEPFDQKRSRLQETNRIYKAISDLRVPTDILVFSNDEYMKWKDSINHVVARCAREGKLLYERT